MPVGCQFKSGAAYSWAPGERMPEQRHANRNELIFVLEGHLRVWGEGGFDVVAGPGDVLLYPRMVFHDEMADLRRPARVFWFAFSGPCGRVLRRAYDHHHRMGLLVRWLMDLRGSVEQADAAMRGQVLALLLAEFDQAARAGTGDPMVERMRRWMTDHLSERITLGQMAAECRFSRCHFVRVYKRLAGRTPAADLRALRIDAACHLLATTDLPAKKIADMTGFGDPYQFAKAFKRLTGTTPRRFRTGRAGAASQ